jgi:ABC-type lipoprotein export system ATPase subunit
MTETPSFWELQQQAATRPRPAYGSNSIIACDNLVKIYEIADLQVVALQGLDLLVDPGELVAIVGSSGSGKSTLLNILGGLDAPSAGKATVAGHDLMAMSGKDRTEYRRSTIGFIWQQSARNLFPYLSAIDNVQMPMILQGTSQRRTRAAELLELVDLGDRITHRPSELSGGEQQRVAIAVALANSPEVLLADEPTGELDTMTSNDVFRVLRNVNKDLGVTLVVVTHDPLVTEHVSRTVAIRDGRTSTETVRATQLDAAGEHQTVAEEFVILDRTGRLQLPEHYVEELHLQRLVRLTLDDDHANVWPDRDNIVTPDAEEEEEEKGQ